LDNQKKIPNPNYFSKLIFFSRINQHKRMFKHISIDYYKEVKRYTKEFRDYHLPLVPDLNPFRYPIQKMYFEMALGIPNQSNNFYNISVRDFQSHSMWAPFRLVKR
jgi:hypothetical protein